MHYLPLWLFLCVGSSRALHSSSSSTICHLASISTCRLTPFIHLLLGLLPSTTNSILTGNLSLPFSWDQTMYISSSISLSMCLQHILLQSLHVWFYHTYFYSNDSFKSRIIFHTLFCIFHASSLSYSMFYIWSILFLQFCISQKTFHT